MWTYNGDDPELQVFYNGDDGPPDREYDDLTEEDVSAMKDSELLAFVRGGGSFRGGPKGGYRKGKKRPWSANGSREEPKREETPHLAAQEI